MTPFVTQRRVDFCDTDMAGIVHFSNFFRYMEFAEIAFLRSRGLSVKMDWEGELIGFPRVSAQCDYVKPATFEDVLDISVTIIRLGQKSVTYGFAFSRGDVAIAKGQVTSVCCRIGEGNKIEAMPIPEGYRTKLQATESEIG